MTTKKKVWHMFCSINCHDAAGSENEGNPKGDLQMIVHCVMALPNLPADPLYRLAYSVS